MFRCELRRSKREFENLRESKIDNCQNKKRHDGGGGGKPGSGARRAACPALVSYGLRVVLQGCKVNDSGVERLVVG